MKRLAIFLLAFATVAPAVVTDPAKAGIGVIFIVNSTGDDNDGGALGVCDTGGQVGTDPECTLRAAIEEANNTSAADAIHFDVPGGGVKVIKPDSTYPIITQPLTIDGYTQPGASENTLAVGNNADLRIRLDGSQAGFATGFNFTAGNSLVRGLSITGFDSSAGVTLSGADNATIEGNFIGTGPGGGQALGNAWGIYFQDHFADNTNATLDATIGGPTPADRNVISGNSTGLEITSGHDHVVTDNYVGTTKSGKSDLGNSSQGIDISFEATGVSIGGRRRARNVIAFNGGNGIEVSDPINVGITILNNSIFSNAGLGIDLGQDGRTANDGVGDADTGANNLQNFPVLLSAKNGARTTITGRLVSTPNETFTIRFFKNPEGARNEGKKAIGKKTITDGDGDGIMPFTFKPEKKVKPGSFVTATATNASGDTSEFSAPRRVRD